MDPNDVNLLYKKGKAKNLKRDYVEATECLSKALRNLDWRDDKLRTQLNYELGYSLHKQEKYKTN